MRGVALALLLLVISGCTTPRWQTTRQPDVLDAAELLASNALGLRRDERPEEVPRVPVRTRLRPCCAFGSALRVRVGAVAVPGFQIANILSPDDIGRHAYDAGRVGSSVAAEREKNGLVYTCRGGFIDTAHVRDYADWTLYLATQIGRQLESGGLVELPEREGGTRRIRIHPVDPELVDVHGRRDLTAALAVWLGYQLSVWHEIATWYGWSYVEAFPELASAFSPEDLYSNLLGAKLAGPIITSGNDLSETLFNRAIDAWFAQSLEFLGGVDADLGEAVMAEVDQVWWDSGARLPDADLVLRRNLQVGARIEPWVVPEKDLSPDLRERLDATCSEGRQAHALRLPSRVPGLDFDDVLSFEIELDRDLARDEALGDLAPVVRHTDFPRIIERIRGEVRAEYGPLGDSPEPRPAGVHPDEAPWPTADAPPRAGAGAADRTAAP